MGLRKGESARMEWLNERRDHCGDDCLLWPYAHVRGYGHFVVNKKHIYAHRYMCQIVHGEPPTPSHQASHGCGNGHKGCVNPKHLSWKTQSENQLDRRQHGTTKRNIGGRPGTLSHTDAERIRHIARFKTQDEIAEMFKTTRGNVQFIVHGKTKTRVFGLERQRIKTVLAKSDRPLSCGEIQIAARLVSKGAAESLVSRMCNDGLIIRAKVGLYTLPST